MIRLTKPILSHGLVSPITVNLLTATIML